MVEGDGGEEYSVNTSWVSNTQARHPTYLALSRPYLASLSPLSRLNLASTVTARSR